MTGYRVTIGYNDPEENIEDGTAVYEIDVSCPTAAEEIALDRHAFSVPSEEAWVEAVESREPGVECPDCGPDAVAT